MASPFVIARTNERTEQVVTRHRSRHQLYRKLLVRLDWYVNSHTVSLPILNIVLRLPGSQVLIFVILTKSSQCLLTLLLCSAAFPMVFSLTVFTCMCTWPSRNPRNNCPKMGRSQWKSHEGWHSGSKRLGHPNDTRLFPPWERAWVWG